MECRKTVGLALALGLGALGCQKQLVDLPGGSRSYLSMSTDKMPDPSQIRKAPTRKDPPLAAVIEWANLNAGEAMSPDIAPARQAKLREDARQAYQRAMTLDPKCVEAYQGLARLYASMQDFPAASENYRKALELSPKNPTLWYEMGLSKNSEKDWDGALECMGKAAQLDPGNRDYLNTLAVLLTRVGRVTEALDCFVRGAGEAVGHYRLARTLQRLQQPELSRQYLEAALQKDPNLEVAQTMWQELNNSASQPIQQTSYHESSVPAQPASGTAAAATATIDPPADLPAANEATPQAPRVILLNQPEPSAPEPDGQSPSQTIVVPPPPTINLRYETPSGD